MRKSTAARGTSRCRGGKVDTLSLSHVLAALGKKMEQCEELSDFDKGKVVGAIVSGLSVSKTAKMVGCSRAAVLSSYRQWHEEGLRLRAGRPRFRDPRELELELEDEGESESEEEEEAPSKVTGGSVSQDVKPPQPDAERDDPTIGD